MHPNHDGRGQGRPAAGRAGAADGRAGALHDHPAGFISINLHRSLDGRRIVNYVQWASREQLIAAHHTPGFRSKWPEVGRAAEEIEPALYEVAHVEE